MMSFACPVPWENCSTTVASPVYLHVYFKCQMNIQLRGKKDTLICTRYG